MARLLAVMVCRAVPAALGAVASVSCAQIAGIDNTSGSARPFDSLAVTRRSIGATLAPDVPLDLTGLAATYFPAKPGTSDFDRVPAEADATAGAWTTQLREPAAVQFTLPESTAPLLFAFPSHQLKVLYAPLEHPGRVPAADAATFSVTAPLDAAITVNDSFQTYVVGAWLQRAFSPTEAPVGAATIGVNYGFTAANSVAGRAKPDKVTSQDAFLILRHTLGILTGVAAPKMAVDQTDGDTVVAMDTMVPVTADRMLDVKVTPGTLMTRYSLVRPAVVGLSMSWSLVAAPGYQIASNSGPVLASGNVGVNDGGILVKYGNPFAARGWNTIFTLATSESRVYTAPGMASISLFAGMNQFIEPSSASVLNLPAGLPLLIKVDGVLLSTDDQMIKQPSQFVRVTFETDTPGGIGAPSATLYHLQVWDLEPNMTAPTVLDRRLVFSAASDVASFALPPEVFQMGHRYTLRAIATLGGYPSLRDGNFVNRELPLAQSYLDSTVIAVVP